jgi:hypothetical protein
VSVAPADYITTIFPTFHCVKTAEKHSASRSSLQHLVTALVLSRKPVVASSAGSARATMSQKPRIGIMLRKPIAREP